MYSRRIAERNRLVAAGASARGRRAPGVLARSVALWDARYHVGGDTLFGRSGAHNAQLGSTAGADSNDPLFRSVAPCLYLPGTASNKTTTPDTAALSLSTELNLQCRIGISALPGTYYPLNCKADDPTKRSWVWYLSSTGEMGLYLSADGSAVVGPALSVATVAAAEGLWLKVTWRASDGRVQYFQGGTSATPTWVQVGTDKSIAIAGIADTTSAVNFGWYTGSDYFAGNVYRDIIYSDIAETTKVYDANYTLLSAYNATRTTLTEQANGATVTLARSASGYQTWVIERNEFLTAVDDYFNVATHPDLNFTAAESFTYGWFGRKYTTANNTTMLAKKANFTTDVGYSLDTGTGGLTPRAVLSDGTNTVTATGPAMTAGAFSVVAVVRRAGVDVTVYVNGVAGTPVADTITGTLVNANDLRIGRLSGAGTSYLEGGTIGAFVMRQALSAADVKLIPSEIGL